MASGTLWHSQAGAASGWKDAFAAPWVGTSTTVDSLPKVDDGIYQGRNLAGIEETGNHAQDLLQTATLARGLSPQQGTGHPSGPSWSVQRLIHVSQGPSLIRYGS